MTAAERKSSALKLFGGVELFLTGLLMLPAFLFNPSLPFRLAQLSLFIIFSVTTGRKIRFLPSLSIGASIVFFNLLVPYGRVLFIIVGWRLTEGALLTGIEKAVTIQGLIILSRATVQSDLRLPFAFGRLLGKTFLYFEKITERRSQIRRDDIIGGIDRILLETAASVDIPMGTNDRKAGQPAESTITRQRSVVGWIILFVLVVACWVLFGFGTLYDMLTHSV